MASAQPSSSESYYKEITLTYPDGLVLKTTLTAVDYQLLQEKGPRRDAMLATIRENAMAIGDMNGEEAIDANEEVKDLAVCSPWTREQTLSMIDSYQDMISLVDAGKMRKKVMWDKIAQSMIYNADQCRGRFKTISTAYKKAKDLQNKTGMSRTKAYEYEDRLDLLFGQSPKVTPVATFSSGQLEAGPKERSDQDTPPKKKHRSQTSDVLHFLKDMEDRSVAREREERELRERMHKEKVDVLKDFLKAIQDK